MGMDALRNGITILTLGIGLAGVAERASAAG